MHLGIEKHTGTIFEGMNNPDMPVRPQPPVSQCHLIQTESDWTKIPEGLHQDSLRWVFREDSFDPVTRIRRGIRVLWKFAARLRLCLSRSIAGRSW